MLVLGLLVNLFGIVVFRSLYFYGYGGYGYSYGGGYGYSYGGGYIYGYSYGGEGY